MEEISEKQETAEAVFEAEAPSQNESETVAEPTPPIPEDEPATSAVEEEDEAAKDDSPLSELIRAGLSEREAMLVLSDRERRKNPSYTDTDSLPRMAHSPRLDISYGELMEMKEIFSDLSDSEINSLYNKVTK